LTADADRQQAAYVDFVSTQKRYVAICYQIASSLDAYREATTEEDRALLEGDLGTSLNGWSTASFDLVIYDSVVRLVDTPALDAIRQDLEDSEGHITAYINATIDPGNSGRWKFPAKKSEVALFRLILDNHLRTVNLFTDTASAAIKDSQAKP